MIRPLEMNRCTVERCGGRLLAKGLCRQHYDQSRKGIAPGSKRVGTSVQSDGEYLAFIGFALQADTNDCIDWPWLADDRRHPKIERVKNGRKPIYLVHRHVCIAAHGSPPFDRAEATHRCGRACCINPKHLRWATHKQNMEDKKVHGTQQRGEACPASKLTERDVREIRRTAKHWRIGALAKRYGVLEGAIADVIHRRTWSHID